ncbi:MAG TPA: YtxH domain-containing protein [Ignavibacteriaceae bacterium]|nr:YtxH domain-containing protein [Ignavibacteriaceae bacterium]
MAEHEKGLNVTALFIGGILGISAVMVLSPKSRKEIKEDIKSKSEKILDRARKNTNNLIKNSRTSAEQLQRKAEEIMDTVQQYAMGKINRPVSVIEREIAGFKAAIIAARTSYSLNPEIHESNVGQVNNDSFTNEFNDETLPKQLGMGKGRNRKTYSP